jgi:uncharacterized protein YyaL (SSP411 family)
VLAGWNGLMLQGLADAYMAFQETSYLDLAVRNAHFIEKHLMEGDHLLRVFRAGKSSGPAFLEDYAFVIRGFIALYEAAFDEHWLQQAERLAATAIHEFYDEKDGLFFFTPASGESLIARKKEIFDNVTPSSNAAMAHNLHLLGLLLTKEDYLKKSERMLATIVQLMHQEPQYVAHWAALRAQQLVPAAEVAVTGPKHIEMVSVLQQHFLPSAVLLGTAHSSNLPLLRERQPQQGKTAIHVCFDKTCKLPVFTPKEALAQIAAAWEI